MPKAQQWLRAHWRWVLAVAAILAMVVVAFNWRNDFACWIGYAAMVDGGLNRGGRFFRDFVIALSALVVMVIAAFRSYALFIQSKVATDNLKLAADNFKLSEDRLLSERFATAAELMAKETKNGDPAISARISGIHIMEKLAVTAPKEFAGQVVKNLIAYVKVHAKLTSTPSPKDGLTHAKMRMLGEDVKAAFTALHNILNNDKISVKIDNYILVFSECNFSHLDLNGVQVNLMHYKIWDRADLTSSNLLCAELEGADFSFSQLNGAILSSAKLMEADLSHAEMEKADLSEADMQGADLSDAILTNADLRNADLRGVKTDNTDMTGADLTGAKYNEEDLEGADLTGATL